MLAERTSLLENSDLYVAKIPTSFLIRLDEPGQCDCAGETGGTATNKKDIHRDGFCVRFVGENEPVEWKRGLMNTR